MGAYIPTCITAQTMNICYHTISGWVSLDVHVRTFSTPTIVFHGPSSSGRAAGAAFAAAAGGAGVAMLAVQHGVDDLK